MLKISVVIAIYNKSKVNDFNLALKSIVKQTYLPYEIIIVYDGLGCEIFYDVVTFFKKNNDKIKFNEIQVEKNVGPGFARNIGIEKASGNLIAIMDSDDYSIQNRFELQINAFKLNDVDLVGGQIDEYSDNFNTFLQSRKVPLTSEEIRKYFKYRNTINNVTVMIKKSVFDFLGGYPNLNFGEDYVLWAKLLDKNYKVINLNYTLVNVRTENNFLFKRFNLRNLKNNVLLSIYLCKSNSVGLVFSILRLFKFIFFMFLPFKLKQIIFKKIIR
jgi:glycosyltransferase involved in cell wall biosynthesis